jgi:hypothetical protein
MSSLGNIWSYILGLVVGVGLFYLGWSQVQKAGTPFVDSQSTTLVVRPANADTGWDGAVVKDPDSSGPLGVRFVPSEAKQLTAQRDAWGELNADNASPGQVTTLRLDPPLSKLDPRTEDGTEVSLSVLPDKDGQPRSDGYIRIAPGRYKFLATAEGHVPKSIDLELSAGVVKKLTVDLKKLPKPPPVAPPVNVVRQPPVPPPRYRPVARPRPYPRPRPRPRPRFTPVAPKPPPRPAPVFTPYP